MAELLAPVGGEWKHCESALRDTPVGLCRIHGELFESGWVYWLGGTAYLTVCDDCAEEAVA